MIINAANNPQRFVEIVSTGEFLAQKIYADFLTQQGGNSNTFYLTNSCALMLSGSNLTLCGDPDNQDMEEIISFCHFCGVETIESQQMNLPLKCLKKMILMATYADEAVKPIPIIKNQDIYSFIKFCCENFDGINFDIAYSNFAKKVNSQISSIYYLKQEQKIVSGAISTIYDENTTYITFVSTKKEHRGKGYAKSVVQAIAQENKDKRIILKCEPHLYPYYQSMGFKPVDTIMINSLKGM